MTQRDTILQELHELKSSLADAVFQNVYQVPTGYFDGLAAEILKRIKALEATSPTEELENLSPLLNTISKKMPHSVPAGYFDTLGKKLEQTILTGNESAQEELETLSPLLSGLRNKKTYTVPAGYFENLQPAVDKENADSKAKVVSITSRKWFRYAAAAVVVGFVATIGFILLNKNESIDPASKSYAWVEKNLKKVSTNDINEFVELANEGTTDIVKTEAKDEISNLLKDVSDKEIQEFLNETQSAETETDDDLILN
jgi:hypothetical protein